MTSVAGRVKRFAAFGLAFLSAGSAGAAGPHKAFSTRPHAAGKAVPTAPKSLQDRITALGQAFDGQVGIAVRSLDKSWVAGWNANGVYPQQSVSKLWISIAVLDAVDKGRLTLDDPVTLTRDDLTLFHQPIADEVLKTGTFTTTVGDLLLREITQSDNTANDKLMRLVGGPKAVRGMIAHKHLGAIRFADGERAMQSRIAGVEWKPEYSTGNAFFQARDAVPMDIRQAAFDRYVRSPYDGAAPMAIVSALGRLKAGELLAPKSTAYLLTIMSQTRTGPNRLKGGLAPGWTLNHKTGTGQVLNGAQAGYNDIGILTAPDGKSYAVAVMIKLTSVPLEVRMALMNEVVRAVIAEHDMENAPQASSKAQ
ncbi:MAG TPA: serine hydrolase [Sphingomicrobium sp.]